MGVRHNALLGGVVLAAGVVGVVHAEGEIIYDNGAADFGAVGWPASQLDPVYPFYVAAADDFVFSPTEFPGATTMTVTGVFWAGVYFNNPDPPPGDITSFRILFWPDAGDMPAGGQPPGLPPDESQAIAVFEIAGNANETQGPGPNEFTYDLKLPEPVELEIGTLYWLQIQPVMVFPPQWAWHRTVGVTGNQVVQGFDILEIPFWEPFGLPVDASFQLQGFETPEGNCFEVVEEEINCHPDGDTFTYTVEGVNACTNATMMFSFTASGGAVGEEMCFTVVVNDDEGGLCCTTQLCVTVPDCSQPAQACPWDLDNTNVVGTVDLLDLLAQWGTDPGGPPDFNGDGNVGTSDLLELLGHWGLCP